MKRLQATHDRNRPLHYGTLQQPGLLLASPRHRTRLTPGPQRA